MLPQAVHDIQVMFNRNAGEAGIYYVSISDINNNSFGKDIIIQGSNMSEKKIAILF